MSTFQKLIYMQIESYEKQKKDILKDKNNIFKQVLNDTLVSTFIFKPGKVFYICNLYYLTIGSLRKKSLVQ